MSELDREVLRALVREALQEALREGPPDPAPAVPGPVVRQVRVDGDEDLAALVAEVLRLADDPDDGPRLRAGSIRFRLASAAPGTARRTAPVRRIERGPVTERTVREAEAGGVRLLLGPAAVLTPMARDRARTAGVEIVRESAGHSGRA